GPPPALRQALREPVARDPRRARELRRGGALRRLPGGAALLRDAGRGARALREHYPQPEREQNERPRDEDQLGARESPGPRPAVGTAGAKDVLAVDDQPDREHEE